MREKGNQYAGECWGLKVHPLSSEQFVTVADDATLRFWDGDKRTMLQKIALQGPDGEIARGRCVTWKPDGSCLAVGTLEGDTYILSPEGEELQMIPSRGKYKNASKLSNYKQVSAVKWAPDCSKLCIAAHTGKLELYDGESYDHIDTLDGHSSAVIHFDWNDSSEHIQSMSSAYELQFWDVEAACTVSASALNDVQWVDWSLTLGWPVQGVYMPEADGTDVNAVAVSPNKELLARADDFGKVGLLKWPCLVKGSQAAEGNGHCSHVTNVHWAGDGRLISCGGHDLCVFQWKVTQ